MSAGIDWRLVAGVLLRLVTPLDFIFKHSRTTSVLAA